MAPEDTWHVTNDVDVLLPFAVAAIINKNSEYNQAFLEDK